MAGETEGILDRIWREAEHRMDNDPTLHARVMLTRQVLEHVYAEGWRGSPGDAATAGAMVALVVAESDLDAWRNEQAERLRAVMEPPARIRVTQEQARRFAAGLPITEDEGK